MRRSDYPNYLAVRMPLDLKDRLKQICNEQEVSVSDFVRQLIENRLGEK